MATSPIMDYEPSAPRGQCAAEMARGRSRWQNISSRSVLLTPCDELALRAVAMSALAQQYPLPEGRRQPPGITAVQRLADERRAPPSRDRVIGPPGDARRSTRCRLMHSPATVAVVRRLTGTQAGVALHKVGNRDRTRRLVRPARADACREWLKRQKVAESCASWQVKPIKNARNAADPVYSSSTYAINMALSAAGTPVERRRAKAPPSRRALKRRIRSDDRPRYDFQTAVHTIAHAMGTNRWALIAAVELRRRLSVSSSRRRRR